LKVVIIPARSGSKRIPGKNIKDFCGKPIIAYSIQAAQSSKLFDRIIVSTDSTEIAEVARSYGAEIPFMRPPELADDLTQTDPVILHALKWLLENGQKVNYVCCIYPTAPLIKSKYIRLGLKLLKQHKATSVIPITPFPSSIFRALKINKKQRAEMFWPQYFDSRSQDLQTAYYIAGQFIWADVGKFLEEKSFYSNDSIPLVLPSYLVQDIDTTEDWKIAETMFHVNKSSR